MKNDAFGKPWVCEKPRFPRAFRISCSARVGSAVLPSFGGTGKQEQAYSRASPAGEGKRRRKERQEEKEKGGCGSI